MNYNKRHIKPAQDRIKLDHMGDKLGWQISGFNWFQNNITAKSITLPFKCKMADHWCFCMSQLWQSLSQSWHLLWDKVTCRQVGCSNLSRIPFCSHHPTPGQVGLFNPCKMCGCRGQTQTWGRNIIPSLFQCSSYQCRPPSPSPSGNTLTCHRSERSPWHCGANISSSSRPWWTNVLNFFFVLSCLHAYLFVHMVVVGCK